MHNHYQITKISYSYSLFIFLISSSIYCVHRFYSFMECKPNGKINCSSVRSHLLDATTWLFSWWKHNCFKKIVALKSEGKKMTEKNMECFSAAVRSSSIVCQLQPTLYLISTHLWIFILYFVVHNITQAKINYITMFDTNLSI